MAVNTDKVFATSVTPTSISSTKIPPAGTFVYTVKPGSGPGGITPVINPASVSINIAFPPTVTIDIDSAHVVARFAGTGFPFNYIDVMGARTQRGENRNERFTLIVILSRKENLPMTGSQVDVDVHYNFQITYPDSTGGLTVTPLLSDTYVFYNKNGGGCVLL